MGSAQANLIILANCLLAMAATFGSCGNEFGANSLGRFGRNPRLTTRLVGQQQLHSDLLGAGSQEEPAIVVGKFKAPAPDRIHRHRVPKASNFGEQTMSASFQVMDNNDKQADEKVVNGVIGASALNRRTAQQQPRERKVSAKIQVSDEGLNYPPSKLSADIYGNVAEIVTAPPEAVDSDFLVPQVSQIFGNRRP